MVDVYRYERKYVVGERMAAAMRSFVRTYLEPDEHMSDERGYGVHSLYLDAPDFTLYRQSTVGLKNRFKLRIRFYDESPDARAYLEIKRRTTETIHKMRATVSKQTAERLIGGERIGPADLISNGEASLRALQEFADQVRRLNARPTALVGYQREAYVAPTGDGARVTFDHRISASWFDPHLGLLVPQCTVPLRTKGFVVELKYNGRLSNWMLDMVASFRLQRISFPKYVHCIDALRDSRVPAGILDRSRP